MFTQPRLTLSSKLRGKSAFISGTADSSLAKVTVETPLEFNLISHSNNGTMIKTEAEVLESNTPKIDLGMYDVELVVNRNLANFEDTIEARIALKTPSGVADLKVVNLSGVVKATKADDKTKNPNESDISYAKSSNHYKQVAPQVDTNEVYAFKVTQDEMLADVKGAKYGIMGPNERAKATVDYSIAKKAVTPIAEPSLIDITPLETLLATYILTSESITDNTPIDFTTLGLVGLVKAILDTGDKNTIATCVLFLVANALLIDDTD